MAAKTFYWKDAVASGSSKHLSLQDGGSAPTAATTTTGWTAGTKAAGQSCLQQAGVEVSSSDGSWGTTLQPTSASPDDTKGDCWRSENRILGTFANGDWTFTLRAASDTLQYTGRFKLAVRVWKGVDASGSDAVELTSGRVVSAATTGNLTTLSQTSVTCTWSPGGTQSFYDEYLFVSVGLEITSAGISSTQDILLCVGSSGTVVTPDLAYDDEVLETLTASGTQSASVTAPAAVSESASSADALSSALSAAAAVSDALSADDALSGGSAFVADVAETAAASDDGSATADMGGTVSSAAGAADSSSAAVAIDVDVSESAAAADEATAGVDVPADVSDGAAAADETLASVTLDVEVADALAADAATDVVATIEDALVESAAAGDATTSLAVFLADVVMAGGATHTATARHVAPEALSEALTADYAPTARQTVPGIVADPVSATDAVDSDAISGTVYNESIDDALAAADELDVARTVATDVADVASASDAWADVAELVETAMWAAAASDELLSTAVLWADVEYSAAAVYAANGFWSIEYDPFFTVLALGRVFRAEADGRSFIVSAPDDPFDAAASGRDFLGESNQDTYEAAAAGRVFQ